MTVWTQVSLEQANEWLKARGLGSARKISGIEEGVEDSVFRLDMMDGNTLCLRLFERTEPEGPVSIALRLAAAGLPTCPPMIDPQGEVLVPLNGKPACLFPWVEGAWVETPSLDQIYEIGCFMGHMSGDGQKQCAGWQRKNPRGWAWFEETATRLLRVVEDGLREELAEEMAAQRAFWHFGAGRHLERGAVHADLFRNNVMFGANGRLSAVIDWGFCASETPLLYDLAIVANDWCLKDGSGAFDKAKVQSLLEGRASVAPLTEIEQQAWPMVLRFAALRFYLSRLVDYHLPRDPNGKALDPDHFGRILRVRRQG